MREVVVEIEKPDGEWHRVGSVSEVEPPGSISSDDPAGRNVYVFGWHQGRVGVWHVWGVDLATPAFRQVLGALEPVSDLSETYVQRINKSERGRMYVRITLV